MTTRVESRIPETAEQRLPTWQEVVDRDYRAWDTARLLIDTTVGGVEESVCAIVARLRIASG